MKTGSRLFIFMGLSTEVASLFISSASLDAFSVQEMCISALALVFSSLEMLESGRRVLMGSASLKEISVAAAIASRFCMPWAMLGSTESSEGWSLDLVATSTEESTRSAACSDLLLVENSSHSSSIALVTGNSVMELISWETSAEISGEDADDDEGEDDELLLLRCRRRLLLVGNEGGGDERGHQ